ncbi:MAG: glycosyltransferase family 4 protein [Chthoniobacter sp.]|uniref:glycosyltransferase family 4 protein n=1 Tax=Chthoniobacter sp. TaxID=2510640 RepID=UPI0032A7E724
MKILFDHSHPFLLAHGGFQTQIEQTREALLGLGVEVDWLRWWDDAQSGDLIHYFGRPSSAYIEFAHGRGLKVVMAELLTGLGSRSAFARRLQTAATRVLRRSSFFDRMGWDSYTKADAVVALTPWEAQLMSEVFGAPPERVHVIPNGVEKVFLECPAVSERGRWLVCTATIAPRKRVVELAAAAVLAGTPLWVLGRPYAEDDAYAQEFRRLSVAHPDLIRYEGSIADRAQLARIYAEARGFVLLSTMESLSLSALEAAAGGCPLLLSDLPWARTTFGSAARYCPIADAAVTAPLLRAFYDDAPGLPCPPRPASWAEIGTHFRDLYARLLKTSR